MFGRRGSCCCGGCSFLNTDFTFADGDDISALGLEETAGDADIDSNTLKVNSSNAVILLARHSIASKHISVQGKGVSHLDELRIIMDYVDPSNYHFAQYVYKTAGGVFQLWQRESGTNTKLMEFTPNFDPFGSQALTANEYNGLDLCISENEVSVYIDHSFFQHIPYGYYYTPFGGDRLGIGTGIIASSVYFDDLKVSDSAFTGVDERCPVCLHPCTNVTQRAISRKYTAVISGSDAGLINGTYTINSLGKCVATALSGQFILTFGTVFLFGVGFVTGITIEYAGTVGGSFSSADWHHSASIPMDGQPSSLVIPYTSGANHASSTLTLTADNS